MVTQMSKTEGLLDRLAVLTGVEYLSDLRTLDYEIIREKLPEIEAKDYPLSQWLDAAEYLSGTKLQADTPQQMSSLLCGYIKTDSNNGSAEDRGIL